MELNRNQHTNSKFTSTSFVFPLVLLLVLTNVCISLLVFFLVGVVSPPVASFESRSHFTLSQRTNEIISQQFIYTYLACLQLISIIYFHQLLSVVYPLTRPHLYSPACQIPRGTFLSFFSFLFFIFYKYVSCQVLVLVEICWRKKITLWSLEIVLFFKVSSVLELVYNKRMLLLSMHWQKHNQ